MAAFDLNDPQSVVSPGGVGFDINCGVRLIRTNLSLKDIEPVKEQLAQVNIQVVVGRVNVVAATFISSK